MGRDRRSVIKKAKRKDVEKRLRTRKGIKKEQDPRSEEGENTTQRTNKHNTIISLHGPNVVTHGQDVLHARQKAQNRSGRLQL